jgi:cyanophycinase
MDSPLSSFRKSLERLITFKPKHSIMLQLETESLTQRMPKTTNAAVMVIGGAEDKIHGRQILQTFWSRAGASDAQIAIIPSASREPEAIGDRYRSIFNDMGVKSIEVLDIRSREDGSRHDWLDAVDMATGVFITGGDQLRLCGLLSDTPIMDRVRMRAQLGEITLAGTSAGAAIMGHHMIAGGGSGESPNRALVDLTTGLSILPELLVDQHFHNRNRMARLMSAIATYPDKLGIGIDEDTCAMFEGSDLFQVIGRGTVTIVDPGQMSYTNQPDVSMTEPLSMHHLKVHILSHGDRFDLHQRMPVPAHP